MTQEKTPASRQALKEGGQLWQADLLIEQKYPRQRKHWTDSNGYNGNLTSAQNGSVGGYMVKKMIEAQERQMAGK